MTRTVLLLCLASALPFAACIQTPTPSDATSATASTDAAGAAIRAQIDRFSSAYNAADPVALGALLAEDAVELQPTGPPNHGRETIVWNMSGFFDEFAASRTTTVDEVVVSGDLAYARGAWTVRQTRKTGGPEQVRSGKWSFIERRQTDGSWEVWRWMWNEDGTGAGTCG